MQRKHLDVAFIGGPQYDALYTRLPHFEKETGYTVNVRVQLPHPALNAHIDEVYSTGAARYDVISTHVKYAPAQQEWLLPLDGRFSDKELSAFSPALLKLARVDGALVQIPATWTPAYFSIAKICLRIRQSRRGFNANTAVSCACRRRGMRCGTPPPSSRGRPICLDLPSPVTHRAVRHVLRVGSHGGRDSFR